MLARNFDFLKHKYRELLLPTLLMLLSDKICFIVDKDYEAVEYIIKKSIKQILIISIPISILFAVYPELFVLIFTIDDPAEMEIICSALRITSVGLIGRSLSLLLSNYAQAIEQNRLASVMNLLEEFIMAFCRRIHIDIDIWRRGNLVCPCIG